MMKASMIKASMMKASDRGRNVKFLGNNFGCVLSKLVNNI